jgi:hypothetical protein
LLQGRSGLSVDQIASKFRGQLKGRILMVHDAEIPVTSAPTVANVKLSDEELKALRNQPPHDKPLRCGEKAQEDI